MPKSGKHNQHSAKHSNSSDFFFVRRGLSDVMTPEPHPHITHVMLAIGTPKIVLHLVSIESNTVLYLFSVRVGEVDLFLMTRLGGMISDMLKVREPCVRIDIFRNMQIS